MTGLASTLKGQSRDTGGTSPDAETLSKRNFSPLQQRPATALAIFAFAIIISLYFWFIQHYSVNTIWVDQWSDIPLIQLASTGHLTLASLWAQHGENRILFQNLIALLLAYSTHYNVVVEEYLSGVMAVAATGLFILAHHRRSPSTPWMYYVPVALVMLSLVQEGNTLYGYAIGWYIVLLALAGAIYLLDRTTLTWPTLAGGIVIAVVGSYSNLYGLLIWPAMLVLFYLRRRPRALVFTWVVSAVVTGAVYFIGFNFQAARGNNGYVLSHPSATINFFFIALGNGLGIQGSSVFYNDMALFGFAIFAISCWVLITYGRRGDESSGSPIGIVMICFGLLFCAFLTLGRAWFGRYQAGWSRYTTYDLVVLVGCYVVVLNRPAQHAPRSVQKLVRLMMAVPKDVRSAGRAWDETIRIGVAVFLTAAIGLQVLLGTVNGISQARAWYGSQILAADLTVNIDKAPGYLIYSALCEDFCFSFIRQRVNFVRAHHLSLFATSAADQYARQGWRAIPVSALSMYAWVPKPVNGARLRGFQWLVAESSLTSTADLGASRVNFYVTGRTLHKALVFRAAHTSFGWLAGWNTTTVSNGIYTIRSVAYTLVGPGTWSAPVQVSVAN
jgi:hypothetical protein